MNAPEGGWTGSVQLGDSWERVDFETGLPDHSRTVHRQVSSVKGIIEQLSNARTPVDSLRNKYETGAETLRLLDCKP